MNKAQMTKYLVSVGLSASVALAGGYLVVPWEGAVKDKQGMHISYLDAVGIPTVCYGQTGKDLYGRQIKLGMKFTEEECLSMLASTLKKFEKQVDSAVKVEWASPYEKAALISFTYNAGGGNFTTSTLLRELNKGNHEYACDQLSRWVYAQKKKLGGLVNRREDERNWCLGNVPYEAKITYSEIVDMARSTTKM